MSIFNACIQIATSEKECALGSFSNRSTPTSATRPDSPFTSFSPGNERCKDLYDAARQISSDVAVRIRDTTRDKIDAKYLIPPFEILDGSDMSMFQSLCFRCVRVSLFGVREDVDRIDRFLEVAVNDFSAACALWRSHHNSVIMHR